MNFKLVYYKINSSIEFLQFATLEIKANYYKYFLKS